VSDKVLSDALRNPSRFQRLQDFRKQESEALEQAAQKEHERRLAAQKLSFKHRCIYTVLTAGLSLIIIWSLDRVVDNLNRQGGGHTSSSSVVSTFLAGIPGILSAAVGLTIYQAKKRKAK